MVRQADPNLVVEDAVWPVYLPVETPPHPPLPPPFPPPLPAPAPVKPEGCLAPLQKLFLRGGAPVPPQAEVIAARTAEKADEAIHILTSGQVTVLLPPPPSVYGLATLFQDNPEANERSREALIQYRAQYDEISSWPYPLRVRKARHTGLPSFLNGYLVSEEEAHNIQTDPTGVADKWLFLDPAAELRAQALFGVEQVPEAASRLQFTEVVQMQQGEGTTNLFFVHVRYQQWQAQWPVFGGGVVVHLATGDRRASATSSYFPLLSDLPFGPPIEETEAIALAQQALAGYLDGPEAIDLYWHILLPWLKERTPNEPPTWGTIETHLAQKQIYTLAAFSQSHDHVFLAIEQAIEAGPLPDTPAKLLDLLSPAWEMWPKFNPLEWQVEVVPYAGSQLFIFPFAGYYHLAYQVELLFPADDQAWRVFIDTQNGYILGQPESLGRHTFTYYTSAASTLNNFNNPAQLPEVDARQLVTDLGRFMLFRFHKGGNVDLVTIQSQLLNNTTSVDRDATNIAYHANKVYEHFTTDCGAPANKLDSYLKLKKPPQPPDLQKPGLKVIVGLENKTGTELTMRFNNAASLHPKPITFQIDNGSGLGFEGKKVFEPSLDPEVVYHEITHGLMWLLNHAPFDEPNSSVPFAPALVEGYANYFARSLAARGGDTTSPLWARAAYKERLPNGAINWDDQWSLSRNKQISGEDLLPAPNMYPSNQLSGLGPYNVGMVWARALWDLRGSTNLTPDQVDGLALNAFNYVHGWIANFETAAEGLIDSARKKASISRQVGAIINIFAGRRILAERGVQALARFQNTLLVGTDAGLKTSTDNGVTWNPVPLGVSGAAQGVVALASEGTVVYAATEEAVYERNSNGNWSEKKSSANVSWPAQQRILYMLVAGGKPYVGTGHGVWQFDSGWTQWGEHILAQLKGLALQMADMTLTSGGTSVQSRYAAMVAGIMYRKEGAPKFVWENPSSVPNTLVTAIVSQGSTVYAGTLNNGVWRQTCSLDSSNEIVLPVPAWVQVVTPSQIGGSAVLCLTIVKQSTVTWLLVGTSSGLFQVNLNTHTTGIPSLTPIGGGPLPNLPTNATVTSVLLAGNPASMLLVGTATQGLFRAVISGLPVPQQPGWTNFSDIGV